MALFESKIGACEEQKAGLADWIARSASLFVIAIGCSVLIGWVANIRPLMTVFPRLGVDEGKCGMLLLYGRNKSFAVHGASGSRPAAALLGGCTSRSGGDYWNADVGRVCHGGIGLRWAATNYPRRKKLTTNCAARMRSSIVSG